MNLEFSIAKPWKIFYGLWGIVIICFAFYLLIIPSASIIIRALLFLISLGTVLPILRMLKSKVIINEHTVEQHRLYSTKEVPITEIRGFYIDKDTITIEPLTNSQYRLFIKNYNTYTDSENLTAYLEEHLTYLDATDPTQFYSNDTHLKLTTRNKKELGRAELVCNIYSLTGFIGGIILNMLASSYVAIIYNILYPVSGILMMAWSKGLIKLIADPRRSIYPFAIIGLVVPLGMLLFRSLNFNILDHSVSLIPITLLGLIILALFFHFGFNAEPKAPAGQIMVIAFLAVVYAVGIVRTVNCQFDTLPPKKVHTVVLSKYFSRDRRQNTSYYVQLQPWEKGQGTKEIEVSLEVYDDIPLNTPITISIKQGLLHIPWL